MRYTGKIKDPKDLITKEYSDSYKETESGEAYQKTVGENNGGAIKLNMVGGKTVVWNQLFNDSIYDDSKTESGITFTKSGGTITVSGTATANVVFKTTKWFDVKANHKYILIGCPDGGSNSTYRLVLSPTGQSSAFDFGSGIICNYATDTVAYISPQIMNGTTVSNLVFKPQIFDLTKMFGAGNEPATVEAFKAMFPLDYYAYDAGSILHGKCDAVVTQSQDMMSMRLYGIPEAIQRLQGYGWSAGTVYNEVNFETKKFIKRVGSVDLGTVVWTRYLTANGYIFYGDIDGGKWTVPRNSVNLLTEKYNTVTPQVSATEFANKGNKIICANDGAMTRLRVVVRDDSYTDAASFTSAMSGVYLYYELATPVETDISAYITDDVFLDTEVGGTVTFHQQNDTRLLLPNNYYNYTKESISDVFNTLHRHEVNPYAHSNKITKPSNAITGDGLIYKNGEWSAESGYGYKSKEPTNIIWTGSTSGLQTVNISGVTYYKISDTWDKNSYPEHIEIYDSGEQENYIYEKYDGAIAHDNVVGFNGSVSVYGYGVVDTYLPMLIWADCSSMRMITGNIQYISFPSTGIYMPLWSDSAFNISIKIGADYAKISNLIAPSNTFYVNVVDEGYTIMSSCSAEAINKHFLSGENIVMHYFAFNNGSYFESFGYPVTIYNEASVFKLNLQNVNAGTSETVANVAERLVTIVDSDDSTIVTFTDNQIDLPIETLQTKEDNSLTTTSKTVTGAINELNNTLQPKTDSGLQTTATTVVGAINELNSGKQETLVSGTNIKTINNDSILGAGNLNIGGLPSASTDGTAAIYYGGQWRKQTGYGYADETSGVDAEWDGDTTGHDMCSIDGINMYYKVADLPIRTTYPDTASAVITEIPDGGDTPVELADATEQESVVGARLYAYSSTPVVFAIQNTNARIGEYSLNAPSTGIYVMYNGDPELCVYVSKIQIENTVVKFDSSLLGLSSYQAKEDNSLQTTSKQVVGAINELNNTKVSKATIVSQAEPTAITLADNTEYTLTNVAALTFTYPASGSYAAWIRLTTAASGTVTVTFPAGTLYVPAVPTFGNSETWLIFVENGIVTAQKAVSGS